MFSDKVRDRLENEPVTWLTTVRPNGQPQTSVVWFLLEGDEILMYSLPDTARVSNIRSNPRVSVNLEGDGQGGAVVTMEGKARIDADAPRASEHPAYLGKYNERIKNNGWTADSFSRDYPMAVRISIDSVRAW